MKAAEPFAVQVIACLTGVCLTLASAAQAQSKTPGDNVGPDHTAVIFAPLEWHLGPSRNRIQRFLEHVPNKSGQRYEWVPYFESLPPNELPPAACTVAKLYDIIHNQTDKLAVLVIDSDGGRDLGDPTLSPPRPPNPDYDQIVVEMFSTQATRDARFDAYLPRDGSPGTIIPDLNYQDITPVDIEEEGPYGISVTAKFFRRHGRLNQSLVYVGTCFGGHFADDMFAGGARVALGPPLKISEEKNKQCLELFFKRLDGQFGDARRSVGSANPEPSGLHAFLINGSPMTTLAPRVIENPIVPCPIKEGDFVYFTLDTTCNTTIIPDIEGIGCTIEEETWLSPFSLRGKCTAPPVAAPARNFEIVLHWGDNPPHAGEQSRGVRSSQNKAFLDGNTDPPGGPPRVVGPNARGPAHDDWYRCYSCPAPVAEGGGPSEASNELLTPKNDSENGESPLMGGPPNDDCSAATPLPLPATLCMETTMGATVDMVPACEPYLAPTAPGVWYEVMGNGMQLTAAINDCGAGLIACVGPPPPPWDAVINVYSGTCPDLTCVAMDDDSCDEDGAGTFLSRVSWCSVAGESYYILVHGVMDASGAFQLEVSDTGPCPPPPVGACCLSTGECSFTDESTCVASGGEFQGDQSACYSVEGALLCYHPAGGITPGDGDLNADGETDGADIAGFTACLAAGPATGPLCAAADLDGDGDVDADDLALFVTLLLGS